VLSGNRNFEARIHPNLKANFLASPPLVVAYAIAGTVLRDLMTEPVGKGKGGKDVWLGDIWPTSDEIAALMKFAMNGKVYKANYDKVASEPGPLWEKIRGVTGQVYNWPPSTYIAEPPFFAASRCSRRRRPRRSRARARWACSATRSRPTTSRPPARSRNRRRPASG
jgi:aconitate hydratase